MLVVLKKKKKADAGLTYFSFSGVFVLYDITAQGQIKPQTES